MPMILLTVPENTDERKCDWVETRIKGRLSGEGIDPREITLWPVKLARIPGRLLLEFKSRRNYSNPNRLAQLMAEVVESVFEIQVEVAVIKLDRLTTGLYITPKK